LRAEGFAVHVLDRKPGIDLGCVRRLARIASESRADLILAHQYTPFFYSRAPGWLGHRPPVVFVEHGRMYPDLPNRKRMMFNRLCLRSTDRVVAVGEAVKRALIANEGIQGDRIEVIYNGTRLEEFSIDGGVRVAMRRELGIEENQPVAIQVARLDYLKDHCTAVRTAEHVRKAMPNFKLLLVGDGPERGKIEREIQTRDLAGTVQLLGQRSDIRRLLAAADAFLLTSISEGIPVTFIEAMGAGLPIVSTAVGGVEEVVVQGETGFVAPAGDDLQLANSLLRLMGNKEVAREIGARGRERATAMFSERAMHARYAALFDQLAGRVRVEDHTSKNADFVKAT
jgi:glycosyltransferase involved in cell wall biosynthesis